MLSWAVYTSEGTIQLIIGVLTYFLPRINKSTCFVWVGVEQTMLQAEVVVVWLLRHAGIKKKPVMEQNDLSGLDLYGKASRWLY